MSDLTPRVIFEEKIPEKLSADPAKASKVNAIYQFNVTGDDGGTWVVNLTEESDWVSEGPNDDAQCTVNVSDSDFVDLFTGKLSGPQAFMLGKIKIAGDMGLAMKLGQVIG